MEPSTADSTYTFDDIFFSLLRVKLIDRKSSNSSFELCEMKILCLMIGIFSVSVATIIMEIVHLSSTSNLSMISVAVAICCNFLIVVIRALALVLNRNVLNVLLDNLEKLFPTSREDQERYNLASYFKPLVYRNKALKLLASFSIILYLTFPFAQSSFVWIILGREYAFAYPHPAWYPFDDKKVMLHMLAYGFQVITGLSATLVFINEDLLFLTTVTQLCMHYRHLGQLISQLDSKNALQSRRALKEIIQYQYALIRLQKGVDKLFSLSTFFAFTIAKIALCMFVFSIVNGMDILNMIPYVLSVFILIILVYLRCSSGTDLYEASESLIYSIYDSNWYEGTPQYRKILLIMMVMANSPCELQASQINKICMEYFKEVMVQTYESFMFLKSFSTGKK